MMRIFSNWLLIAGFCWVGAAWADDVQISQKLDAIVSSYAQAKKFNGSVLITKKGQTVFSASYGVQNLKTQDPLTTQMPFMIASLSKPFTATMILKLVEDGKLNLDQKISPLIQNAPAAWSEVTIRHLLSHTSGIFDYLNSDQVLEPIRYKDLTPEQLIDQFRKYPLNFAPGSQQKYSNSGYVLLGSILQTVTGVTYEQLLKTLILNPLQMDHTEIKKVTEFSSGYAHPLRVEDGQYVPGPLMNPSVLFGAANITSTVEDLHKFDQALYGQTLLKAETIQAMFTPVFDRYGLGFAIRSFEGRKTVLHNGNITGFSSRITRFVDDGVTITILQNLRQAPTTELTEKLASSYFSQ